MSGPGASLDNLVQALAVQGQDLWIGTARGLFHWGLADGCWHAYPLDDGLADVRSILPGAQQDDLWVASGQSGMRRIKGRLALVQPFPVPASVLGLAPDHKTGAWAVAGLDLGQRPEGIYRWDGTIWSLILRAAELRLNSLSVSACIQTVACAANGRIWIGTSEGLFGWSPGAPPEREPSAGKADVRSLLALEDNGLCVAAAEGLLVGIPGSLALVAGWDGRAVNALAFDVLHRSFGVAPIEDSCQLCAPQVSGAFVLP